MPDTVRKEPRTARQVNRSNFNRLIGAVEGLANIVFDKTQFTVTWQGPIPIVRLRSQGNASFSGYVWVAGKRFDLTAATPQSWIKVDVDAGTVAYDATGPADATQFEDGVEWYRTAYTAGDIHVTRF